VKIASRGTSEFWRLYQALPAEVRTVALHFKSIGKPNWSVRVGDHYRAIGQFIGEEFVWEWIGSHADYDKWL
jgi:hypothetical protein